MSVTSLFAFASSHSRSFIAFAFVSSHAVALLHIDFSIALAGLTPIDIALHCILITVTRGM